MFLARIIARLTVTVIVDLWWTLIGKKRAFAAFLGSAKELRFTPGGFPSRWEDWEIPECYEGQLDGISTAMGLAFRYEMVGHARLKVAAVLIKTKTPMGLAFHYEIGGVLSSVKSNFKFPDPELTRKTLIKSDNGGMLVTLLDNVGIRGLILNFLSSGKEALLNEYSGWMEVRKPQSVPSSEISAHVRRTARVTRALHDRAVAAGFLHQAKAA